MKNKKTHSYFTSHDIRSSTATMDYLSGLPEELVSKHCGHGIDESVRTYISHLKENNLSINVQQTYQIDQSVPVFKPSFEKWTWPKQLSSESDMKKFFGLQKTRFKKKVEGDDNYY